MFSCFQTPLDLAHRYFKTLVLEGDLVIDATCGKGKDTLILAKQTVKNKWGRVYAFDIQKEAIAQTKSYLQQHLCEDELQRIIFFEQSHALFPPEIPNHSVKLIVYNLGYLPGGDKSLTTKTKSTLQSLNQAKQLLMPGGALSITCYPGHEEGKKEETAILEWSQQLLAKEWSCCLHQFVNRKLSPSLLFIQKTCV